MVRMDSIYRGYLGRTVSRVLLLASGLSLGVGCSDERSPTATLSGGQAFTANVTDAESVWDHVSMDVSYSNPAGPTVKGIIAPASQVRTRVEKDLDNQGWTTRITRFPDAGSDGSAPATVTLDQAGRMIRVTNHRGRSLDLDKLERGAARSGKGGRAGPPPTPLTAMTPTSRDWIDQFVVTPESRKRLAASLEAHLGKPAAQHGDLATYRRVNGGQVIEQVLNRRIGAVVIERLFEAGTLVVTMSRTFEPIGAGRHALHTLQTDRSSAGRTISHMVTFNNILVEARGR